MSDFVDTKDIPLIRDDIDGPTCAPTLLFLIEWLLDGNVLEAEEERRVRDLATYAHIRLYRVGT